MQPHNGTIMITFEAVDHNGQKVIFEQDIRQNVYRNNIADPIFPQMNERPILQNDVFNPERYNVVRCNTCDLYTANPELHLAMYHSNNLRETPTKRSNTPLVGRRLF